MTNHRTVRDIEPPPGWTVTHRRRPTNHHRLATTAGLTIATAISLAVATHAGLVPIAVTGIVLGLLTGTWHIYLARPVSITHATPPTPEGADHAQHHHEATPITSR